jgi:hypothetical protein
MTYNFCQKCCIRFEGCADCHEAELAAKDKEIEGLKDTITSLRVQFAVLKEYVNNKVTYALVGSEQ